MKTIKELCPHRFQIQNRECGMVIESESTIEQARELIKQYEEEDIAHGEYVFDYYCIYDTELETIVE